MGVALAQRTGSFHLPRERVLLTRAVPKGARHVPDCTLCLVFNNRGDLRGLSSAVALVDILDDFFSTPGFEVHIDIGLFVAQR